MKKAILIPILILSHTAVALLAFGLRDTFISDELQGKYRHRTVDRVLDGDTVVKDGEALHIRGIDAPELGPWANCWAEAAAAGRAKSDLETELFGFDDRWTLVDRKVDSSGRASVRIVDQEGFDISDTLSVHSFAALTDEKWDWCGSEQPLQPVLEGTRPSHGPNLWWPSGNMFDPRARD